MPRLIGRCQVGKKLLNRNASDRCFGIGFGWRVVTKIGGGGLFMMSWGELDINIIMLHAVAKKQKLDVQKQKLAENMTKTKGFWTEKNNNPTCTIVSTSIDQANSPLEISKLFLKK